MAQPKLYRRRFIPDELIHFDSDEILLMDKDLLITKWNTRNPRKDIQRGISAFYLDKGFKISKMYDYDNQPIYWYCDIIQVKTDDGSQAWPAGSNPADKKTIIIEDLLVDVVLFNDGVVKILDLDELADAMEQKLISLDEAAYALKTAKELLDIIYKGKMNELTDPIDQAELL